MPKNKKLISVIIICFNEEANIFPTYQALKTTTDKNKKYQYEFIFIDNGSLDETRLKIKQVIKQDKRVTGVFLSRNFGPEASGQAGRDQAHGQAIILFEGDLQDPPDLILKFINKWEQGAKVVVGIRTKTEDGFFLTIMRRCFYQVLKYLSDIDVPITAGAFSLIDRQVLLALRSLPEKYRFARGLRAWVGFKPVYIKYKRRKRERGKSSYNLFRYLKFSERGIFGFSYFLLDFIAMFCFLLFIPCFIFSLTYLPLTLFLNHSLKDLNLNLLVLTIFSSVQLLSTGIIAKYIQVIARESKARPIYIIEETLNLKTN